ncbi:hypothetical protein CHUAL_005720 [Chamberlinius hualienensis]
MAAIRFIVFSAFVLMMAVLLIEVGADPEPFADPEPVANPEPLRPSFPPCIIPPVLSVLFNPVCGSNGVTYRNIYYFRCDASRIRGLTLRHPGACRF